MPPTTDTTRIVSEILQLGFLRIRQIGWSGNASRCAIEADHLHNLPQVLLGPSSALLSFYWEVEKPAFEANSSDADLAMFRPLWAELQSHIPQSSTAVA